MSTYKRDFVSGLIVLVPLIVTVWVAIWLLTFIAGAPIFVVFEEEILIERGVMPWLAGILRIVLTLFVFSLLIFAVGYFMRTAIGEYAESKVDDWVNHLPGVRVVYNASKMAIETALGQQDTFQKPVKVEPWPGMRMTAFKTGKQTVDGREIIFMPTAPNITTGFVMEVPGDYIVETDEQVEQALTRLLSAGFGETNDSNYTIAESGRPLDQT